MSRWDRIQAACILGLGAICAVALGQMINQRDGWFRTISGYLYDWYLYSRSIVEGIVALIVS